MQLKVFVKANYGKIFPFLNNNMNLMYIYRQLRNVLPISLNKNAKGFMLQISSMKTPNGFKVSKETSSFQRQKAV